MPVPATSGDASPRDAAPSTAVLAVYALLYCLLDWVSFIQPLASTEITAWNPQWALAVALMTRARRLGAPILVTLLAAAVLPALRHAGPPEMIATWAEVFGDVALALAIRRWLGPAPSLATRQQFLVFMLLVAGGAALQTLLYAGAMVAMGATSLLAVRQSLVGGWVAAVNLVVALPLIFALGDRQQRRELATMAKTVEWWLIAAASAALAHVIFFLSMGDQFKRFYLLFVPLGWAAARFGTPGAIGVATVVQLVLAVAAQSRPYESPLVFELHMLLVVLGATGLLVGATVSERQQAANDLRASLRAAAAADTAAALAHDLHQPLLSLVGHARATQRLVQRLVQRLDGEGQGATEQVVDATRKLAREAMRASEIVERLRDAFSERRTKLELIDLGPLIDDMVAAQVSRAQVAAIDLTCERATNLPRVLVDRVQLEVVLRNLMDNALDAAAQRSTPPAFVTVRAEVRNDALLVEVLDSGHGVPASELRTVFEDHGATRPHGLGLGLALSRSIIRAHDGRLWAEAGPGGKFFFSLPVVPAGGATL